MNVKLPTNVKNMKDSLSAFKNGAATNVVAEIERTYADWLHFSGLTDDELLRCCGKRDFTIIYEVVAEIEVCKIGFTIGNKFSILGRPIISNGNAEECDMWKLNVSLLLFFIARKLDMELKQRYINSNHHNHKQDDYFYQCVKQQWND